MKYYFGNDEDEIQVGIDEAGRGCFAGPVFAAAVIWDRNKQDDMTNQIKDSKKLSKKKRNELRKYIEENAIAYSVQSCDKEAIEEMNILQATYKAMHKCLKNINVEQGIEFDRILVDGDRFKPYACQVHECIPQGDNHYICIAAASILAKTYHDEWITNVCEEDKSLDEKYKWLSNMGYGTKAHREGIMKHGITELHRDSFCKKWLVHKESQHE